jgi:hypothetical protein
VTRLSKETWDRVLGVRSKRKFRKAENAIITKHLENPDGWLGRADLKQEVAIHLAHKLPLYHGAPSHKGREAGYDRAQIMTFVRPTIDRKVRDLVERDLKGQPTTIPLRTEPEEHAGQLQDANDPGIDIDIVEILGAGTYLKLKLARPGGTEWLAQAFGYPLNPSERQRFLDRLTPQERDGLQRFYAAWILS